MEEEPAGTTLKLGASRNKGAVLGLAVSMAMVLIPFALGGKGRHYEDDDS